MAQTKEIATKVESKEIAKKEITKAVEATKSKGDKKMTKAVEETKAVKNEAKKDRVITIQEATKLYEEVGIKCKNPQAKGNYRIMGSGSSLNIKPKSGYYIYSSDEDLEFVQKAKIKAGDLVIEKGTNAQDKVRPNTVVCTAVETLKALLTAYALNPKNNAKELPAAK